MASFSEVLFCVKITCFPSLSDTDTKKKPILNHQKYLGKISFYKLGSSPAIAFKSYKLLFRHSPCPDKNDSSFTLGKIPISKRWLNCLIVDQATMTNNQE